MKYLQIWQEQKSGKKLLATLILSWLILIFYPYGNLNAQQRLAMKMRDGFPTLKMGDIGSDYPCGLLFGISLEDHRYIFCEMSSMNATLTPDDVDFSLPNGTRVDADGQIVPKTDANQSDYNTRLSSYQAVSDKINQLNVGVYNTEKGTRWGIIEKDIKTHYPEDAFDIVLHEEACTAFNSEALFYEMLVTIQKLSQDNAALELRLNQIESKIGVNNQSDLSEDNYIKIITNPTNSNTLDLEYQIESDVANANILLSSTSGKTIQTIAFKKRGFGYEYINFDLPKGLYYCTLVLNDKVMETQKFVAQ